MVDSLNGLPAVTPDGSTFIFDRTDANGNGSLWRVQADGSHEHRLPSLGGMPRDGGPTLSPDGHQIAVARGWGKLDRHEDLKAGLYIQHLDGSSPRLVAPFGYRADVGGATWPPDGRTLVFAVLNNGPGRPPAGENAGLEITLPRPTQTSKLIDLETFARGAQPKRRPDTRQTRRSIACAN